MQQQLPQMIAQYQQNMEYLNQGLLGVRRNLERTDIQPEERENLRKQEQELQGKLALHQTLISNLTPQMVAHNLQQRMAAAQQQQQQQQQMGSPASNDNMSVNSTPGSPATFATQQPQQNLAAFANNAAALQQQLRMFLD